VVVKAAKTLDNTKISNRMEITKGWQKSTTIIVSKGSQIL